MCPNNQFEMSRARCEAAGPRGIFLTCDPGVRIKAPLGPQSSLEGL